VKPGSCTDCGETTSNNSAARCRTCENARRVDRDRDMAMARSYCRGLTLKEVGHGFKVAKSTVCKALERVGCKRRPSGTRSGRESVFIDRRAKYPAEPHIPVRPQIQVRVWCAQCERKVVLREAAICRSRWCAAKAAAPPINKICVDKPNPPIGDRTMAGA
jgi:hypothetical protein